MRVKDGLTFIPGAIIARELAAQSPLTRDEAERINRAHALGLLIANTDRHNGNLAPEQENVLEKGVEVIERNAYIQRQLIDDPLEMSRIISGKIRLDIQEVEIPTVIERAFETAQPAAQAKEIRIQKIIDPRVTHMHGNPARPQQVVWNLLSNAIKFTPRAGRVQIVLQRINSHVELIVSDTGQG